MISLKPPYEPITQLPVFCGPACFEMVLTRHGIKLDQEVIAQSLGTYVRATDSHRYQLHHPTADPLDHKQLGIRLIGIDQRLNQLAAQRHWPLSFVLRRLSEIADLAKLLQEELSQNHDVVVNFWLNEDRPKRKGIGHFVLAESFDPTTRMLQVVDPDTDAVSSRWSIDVDQLTELMGAQWDGADRGVLIVRTVDQ